MSWPFDDDGQELPTAPAAEADDDRTVIADLPVPITPAAPAPVSDPIAEDLPWYEQLAEALKRGVQQAETRQDDTRAACRSDMAQAAADIAASPDARALFGHGLGALLRQAARRRNGAGLHRETLERLARRSQTLLRHPDDAVPDDQVLATLQSLLDSEPEPEGDLTDPPVGYDSSRSTHEMQSLQAVGLGLFSLLRDLERRAGDKPRIGRNARLHQAVVSLGQDPYLGFPTKDIARYDPAQQPPMVRAQFMGFFGPFGAFPLNWTEEAVRWFDSGDESFAAFVNIFTTRFQELFYRAWADARAITQFDHPADDRFQTYMLSLLGNGTEPMRGRDSVPDTVKLRFAGLASGRIKSPTRLAQILRLHFEDHARVEIDEMVPTWLDFEPDTLSQLGRQGASLGRDMHLGSRVRTVSEKIRLNLRVQKIETYFRLLPGGDLHAHLRDLTFWYLGLAYEIEVALWLPQPEIRPAKLGETAQLGWMACIAPQPGDPDTLVCATHYKLEPPDGDTDDSSLFDWAA